MSLDKAMTKALSGEDIQKIAGCPLHVLRYRELYDVKRIEDVLPMALLYEVQDRYGHWISVFTDREGNLNVFDPYGYKIDSELLFVPKAYRAEGGAAYPILTRLLYEWAKRHPSKEVIDNQHRLQGKDPKISTCGRHAGLRIKFREMPLREYYTMLRLMAKNSGMSVDKCVTALTEPGGRDTRTTGGWIGVGRNVDIRKARRTSTVYDERRSTGRYLLAPTLTLRR